MDFKQKTTLGGTGLAVTRLGLASGYGIPASGIEKAVHEYGVNYLYLSPLLNMNAMVRAVRNFSPQVREDLCIVLARPLLRRFRLENYVDTWLKKMNLDPVDLLFQDYRKPMPRKLADRVQELQQKGKIRFLGMSSHNRPLVGQILRGEVDGPADFLHVRYNAVHSGAEQDIFPCRSADNRPGIIVFTATCWRKLLKDKNMPEGERPLTAAECYRFVLSRPEVDICITAPKTTEQMEANMRALEDGPLTEEEMQRARRIGKHIYGK